MVLAVEDGDDGPQGGCELAVAWRPGTVLLGNPHGDKLLAAPDENAQPRLLRVGGTRQR